MELTSSPITDADLVIATYQQQAQRKDAKIFWLEVTIDQLNREIAILQGDVSRLSMALRTTQAARNDEAVNRMKLAADILAWQYILIDVLRDDALDEHLFEMVEALRHQMERATNGKRDATRSAPTQSRL